MPNIITKFEWYHPLRGRQMQVGWVKICHFRRKMRLTRKRYKIDDAAILYFRNREFLFAVSICREQTHQCSKFHQNWSLRCGDIAFFPIFKTAAAAILNF